MARKGSEFPPAKARVEPAAPSLEPKNPFIEPGDSESSVIPAKKENRPTPPEQARAFDSSAWSGRATESSPKEYKARMREMIGEIGNLFSKKKDPAIAEGLARAKKRAEWSTSHANEKSPERADEIAARADVAPERATMRDAEKAYLDSYKEFHAKNNALVRSGKLKLNTKEVKNLYALKLAYDNSRVAYAAALERSVQERFDGDLVTLPGRSWDHEMNKARAAYKRLEEKNKLPTGADGKSVDFTTYQKEYQKKVLERYRGIIRFNEIVKPAAEKALQARTEALDGKGKLLHEKALGVFAKGNQALEGKFGKNGARAVRALASAVVVTGGAAAFGTLGTTGILAAAGYGTYRFGRSLVSTFASAGLGEAVGKFYEKTRGRRKQAEAAEALKTEGRRGELTADDLDHADYVRENLTMAASERTLAKKKALIKALTAFGLGAGTSAAIAAYESVQHSAEVLAQMPHDAAGAPGASHVSRMPVQEQPSSAPAAHTPEAVQGSATSTAEASAAAPVYEVTSTIGKGEGADQFFKHFQDNLRQQYPDTAHLPPVVRHILDAKNPDTLAREVGFVGADGKLFVLHPGDSLSIDNEGRLVLGQAIGHLGKPETQVLMDTSGSALEIHTVHGTHMMLPVEQGSLPKPPIDREAQAELLDEIKREHPVNLEHQGPTSKPDSADDLTRRYNPEVFAEHAAAPTRPVIEAQPLAPATIVGPHDQLSGAEKHHLQVSVDQHPGPINRAVLDAQIKSNGISPAIVAEAVKAAPRMEIDPTLISYVRPNTGAIPGPAVFLGKDGSLTVYGATSPDQGDMYHAQVSFAAKFAAESGQKVNVLLPEGARGHIEVSPDGTVVERSPGFLRSYKPPPSPSDSVFVFPR